jgi:hypothetical protein
MEEKDSKLKQREERREKEYRERKEKSKRDSPISIFSRLLCLLWDFLHAGKEQGNLSTLY